MALKIFLSHSHQDQAIAAALAGLLGDLFRSKVSVDYSSDQNAGGGIPPGEQWLPWIVDHIKRADGTFVLLTPNSMHRPWVLWESGAAAGVALAAGRKRPVVPITFGVAREDIPSPFSDRQPVQGDSAGITRLLQDWNSKLAVPLSRKTFESNAATCVPPFLAVVKEALANAASEQSILADVKQDFPASKLAGQWATAYTFTSGNTATAYHADISIVVADSERRVRARNYAARTQNHDLQAFENAIQAELVNRHLIGQWRNLSDERYFGAVHLAVLTGEAVMDGYYTSLSSDIVTNSGHWLWVRLKEAVAAPELNTLRLKSPADVYAILTGHKESKSRVALDAILENQ